MGKVIPHILDMLRSNRIKPPYFHNLNELGFTREEIRGIMEEYYGGECLRYDIYKNHKLIYSEEFVDSPHPIYTTVEYVGKNNITITVDIWGEWTKSEYDEHENRIYYERSNGYWEKREYDKTGMFKIYQEDSDGIIINKRNKYETDQQDKTPRNH